MSAKLVSTKTELTALRGLCSVNRKISGRLVGSLDETYFNDEESVEVFKRIQTVIRKEGEPPKWLDLREDPGLSERAKDFLDNKPRKILDVDDAARVVSTLNKYRVLRGLYMLAEATLGDLQQDKVDSGELLEKHANALAKLRVSRSIEEIALHYGSKNNTNDFIRKMLFERDKKNYLPTGFSDFDRENGGFLFKTLVTIAGTSGGGKSAVASQLAKNWAEMGEAVVLVPLEMGEEEQSGRLLANISKIDSRKIILKRLTTNEAELAYTRFKKWVRKVWKQGGRYTIFKPREEMTMEQILPVCMTYGPRVIIIDYVSLLKGMDDDNQWRKLGEAARAAKVFAESNNIIVLILAQLNEDGRIRYAQAIKEHSDYAWTFVATKETMENEVINVEQLKGRNANRFPFSLRAQLSTMTIGDIDESEVPQNQSKGKPSKTGKKADDDAGTPPKKSYLKDITDDE